MCGGSGSWHCGSTGEQSGIRKLGAAACCSLSSPHAVTVANSAPIARAVVTFILATFRERAAFRGHRTIASTADERPITTAPSSISRRLSEIH